MIFLWDIREEMVQINNVISQMAERSKCVISVENAGFLFRFFQIEIFQTYCLMIYLILWLCTILSIKSNVRISESPNRMEIQSFKELCFSVMLYVFNCFKYNSSHVICVIWLHYSRFFDHVTGKKCLAKLLK